MATRSLAGGPPARSPLLRLLLLLIATLSGLLLSAGLLAALGVPTRSAYAAPAAVTRPYPGAAPCNTSLQACLDGADPGDTIVIQPNTYITSVTLNKAVSLTGVSSATVILQALPVQRVLTVTGAAISNSVVISGLTFRGGVAFGAGCPVGCGGAILITETASPLLHSLIITNNIAWHQGGGLFASAGSALRLTAVNVLSNTSISNGGGIYASRPVNVTGGLYQNNRCVGVSCGAAALLALGTMDLSGAQFISNTSQGSAGAVYAPFAAAITGGLFQDNRCIEDVCSGGALYANSSLVVTGTQFLSNTSRYYGGALFANQPASLTSALFRNNRCTQTGCGGGAVYGLSSLVFTSTSFISNSSISGGGAALAASTLAARDGLFQDNRCTAAGCQGGGMAASFGLVLTNMQVLSNTATGDGGGAHTSGLTTLSAGLFLNNRCTETDCNGGALLTAGGLTLLNTSVISNSSGSNGGAFHATGPVTLTGGLFQSNRCTQPSCGASALLAAGPASVSGTQFISNTSLGSAGAVYVPFAAVFTGGLFQDNRCTEDVCIGGALYANNSLALTGTQFLSNTSRYHGGALFTNQPATLTSALFRNNQCTQAGCGGGAIYALARLTVSGTQFLSNTSPADGGAVLATAPVAARDSLFQDNHCTAAGCDGGAIATGHSLALTNTQVLSSTATGNGGGAYSGGPVTLDGAVFQNNHCVASPCQGGGLYANDSVHVTSTQFLLNTSYFDGGGLFASGPVTVSGGLFDLNACTQTFCFAGGLMAESSAAITGARFTGNSSQSHGGGAYTGGPLTVSSSEFRGNQSGIGGGLNHAGPSALIVNSLFAGNRATSLRGAAVSLIAAGNVALVHNTIASATVGSGSAVFVQDATVRVTNTLLSSYTVGLERASGTLAENYTLFASVAQPYSGTVSPGVNSFTGTAGFANPALGNFHLSHLSDAVDAALPSGVLLDFDGDPRPSGPAPDIGFDEYVARLFLPLIRR